MEFFLYLLFVGACYRCLVYFKRTYLSTGFDWFSGPIFILIYLVFCALFYLAIFTPYYLIKDAL